MLMHSITWNSHIIPLQEACLALLLQTIGMFPQQQLHKESQMFVFASTSIQQMINREWNHVYILKKKLFCLVENSFHNGLTILSLEWSKTFKTLNVSSIKTQHIKARYEQKI